MPQWQCVIHSTSHHHISPPHLTTIALFHIIPHLTTIALFHIIPHLTTIAPFHTIPHLTTIAHTSFTSYPHSSHHTTSHHYSFTSNHISHFKHAPYHTSFQSNKTTRSHITWRGVEFGVMSNVLQCQTWELPYSMWLRREIRCDVEYVRC